MDVAAGAVSFAFIAIQLGKSFVALYRFWESIEEAPANVSTVIEDLRHLAANLKQMALDDKYYGQSLEMIEVLECCRLKAGKLRDLVKGFVTELVSRSLVRQRWNALKAAAKNDKVERFQR